MSITEITLGNASEDYRFAGIKGESIEGWEDGLRLGPAGGPGSFEWWYVDGHLHDGSLFSIAFHYRKDSDGTAISFINFNFAGPSQKVMKRLECNADEFSAAKDRCDTHLGVNFIRSEGLDRYEIYVDPESNGGVGANLRLERTAPSYRPGSGYFRGGDDYMGWLCAVPVGKLSGAITIDGTSFDIEGSGYHDHNWGNIPIDRLISDWYWGRAEIDGYTIVMANVRAREDRGGQEMPLLYIVKDGNVVLDVMNSEVACLIGGPRSQPDTGKKIAADLIFVADTEGKPSYVRFRGDNTIGTFPWVNTDPKWETWYTRFSAAVTLDLKLPGSILREGGAILEHMDFFGRMSE